MEKQLALIADSANMSVEGKLNILGEFDTIWAESVPVTHPILWFVAKLVVGASDVGRHRILLRIVDEDGNTVLPPIEGQLDVVAPGAGFSGEHARVAVVLGVAQAPFVRFGTYTFELRVDDGIVAEVPLYVSQIQQLGA